jgi:hypothetical protein
MRIVWLHVVYAIAVMLTIAFCLVGCADASHGLVRTMYGIDCRPEHLLPNGHCAPVQ